jgi:NADH-quinone oxidoreductase subunit H
MDFWMILTITIQALILALGTTAAFAYMTWFERRLLARFQHRIGPNRAGPSGLLQPVADAVKLFLKEDIIPATADRWVYLIAPALAMIPAIIIWATIPLGCFPTNLNGDFSCAPGSGNLMHLADVNIGVLYLLAVTGIGVYGIAIAGWASNNKYSMLGGVRASAQVLSYELSLSLAVLGVVMQAATFSTSEIVYEQRGLWFVVPQFLGFVIFILAATAEVVRAPFDLVEAEQELVGGYNTEYGSMKFALFFMSEYIKLIAMSAITVTLYLGGWSVPGADALAGIVSANSDPFWGNVVHGLITIGAFSLKVLFFLFVSVWIRASLPRLRYDQLMDLGWKILLPLSLFNVVLTAIITVLLPNQPLVAGAVGFVVGLIALIVVARLFGTKRPNSKVTLVKKSAVSAQQ